MTSGRTIWWCALLTLSLGVGRSANATIEIVGEARETFIWNTSAGPVAGYYVDPSTRQLSLWLMDRAGVHVLQGLGVLATGWLPTGFAVKDDVAID
jgi:hypothetical protein